MNESPLTTFTHEQLEALAEDAEDFLNEMRIELISHSYGHIIAQAQQHGFKV
jgi:hypothetical protein